MHKTKRQKRTHKRRQRKSQRGGGSDFNVPIRSFYPPLSNATTLTGVSAGPANIMQRILV